ncbi:flagellar biosynthesis anti-sigma factor FlgM [bacterium]|nr:flagellar biosynthesis anti-sigma factor FlgM [bacterium]
MKVGPLTQLMELYQKKGAQKQQEGIPSNKKSYDSVSISKEAYEKLQQKKDKDIQSENSIDMGKILDEVTSVDHPNIQKIKKQIADGTYKIDFEAIADALIEDY